MFQISLDHMQERKKKKKQLEIKDVSSKGAKY